MNKQEIVNAGVKHIREHGLSRDGTACVYRGPGEKRCHVGILIKDEHYSVKLETHAVGDKCVMDAVRASGVGEYIDEDFLSHWQLAHDRVSDLYAYHHHVVEFCKVHGLEVPR